MDKYKIMEGMGYDLCSYCANIGTCQLFNEIKEQRPFDEFSIAGNDRCHYKRNGIAYKLDILKILERRETMDIQTIMAEAGSYVLPPPTGWFRKKCPECGQKVKLIKHSWQAGYMTGWQLWEYICTGCDYRYVKEHEPFDDGRC